MDFPFLRQESFGLRTQETFVGNKCEIFLPEYYFNKNDPHAIAVDLGDKIQTSGLFWFRVDGRDWYELQLPLKFEFQFAESRKETTKIKPTHPEEKYIVYTLTKGMAFVYDIKHKKDIDDFKRDFISKLVEGAKLPSSTSYNDMADVFMNAMISTGLTGLGVSMVSIEFMLSELCRSRKNMHDPFRLAYNGHNEYDYKMVRITKIPQLNSTFTGLIGEDINNQIVSSVLKNREGVIEKESPIERIIKY